MVRASLRAMSVEEAVLLVVVGLVLGVFPMAGLPTVLCLAAAFGLRLNGALLQLVNSFTTPLQLVLLIPLERAGAKLCGAWPVAGGSAAARAGLAVLHAVTGWTLLCIPLGLASYVLVMAVLRARRLSWSNDPESTV